jgi:tetratricopeptide (TPR) repeat protein
VAGKKILLLLDDAAGHEQVRPLLPGTAGSLVLVTSRRRLTALEDAAVVSLDTLPPDEAAALLVRLAARPGLRARDAAVREITGLCGYLPLAIGMLARQLRHHPAWTPGELAADLAVARDRLALMRAENLSVGATFGLSYADLTPGQQQLFRRLGLVPGPAFDAYAAAALGGTSLDEARRCLDELYDQHLLTEPAPGRYQLHDLLREHAQTLAAADGPAHGLVQSPVLVGRDDFLALAARRLADAAAGGGQLLFVAGEAGIGKTRLLGAVARRAQANGFAVVRAAAFPGDVQSLAGLLLDLASNLVPAPEPALSELGQNMASRVRAVSGEAGDAHHRRRLLVQDLADLIVSTRPGPPVLIILEDLHWADEVSLDVLGHLASRLATGPMLVAGTYRSDELYPQLPMRDLRGRLLGQRLAEEIRLPRLGLAQTAAMTSATLGRPAPAQLVQAIHERSDGIPLHVEEFLAAVYEDALTPQSGAAVHAAAVPDTLGDAVLTRARHLTTLARDVASAAAVIGRSFDFDLLTTISEADPDEVAGALRELQDAYLVLPGADAVSFDFRHALIRDTLYTDTGLPLRRRLHERVARAAADRGYRGAFISAHFEQAGHPGRAYEYAVAAAGEAVSLSAHGEALELYRRAARNLPAQLPPLDRAALFAALGDEAAATDDNKAAAEAYRTAHGLASGAGDVRTAAALVPRMVAVAHLLGDGVDVRIGTLRTALASLDGVPETDREHAQLGSAMAAAYLVDDRLDEAITHAQASRAESQRIGDEEAALDTAATLGSALVYVGRMDEGWELLEDVIARANERQQEAEAARGYRMIGSSASALVEYDRAERWLIEGIRYAENVELWNHCHYMASHLAHVQWATGQWGAARQTAQQALADGRGGITTRITAQWVLGYLAMGRGDWDTAARLLGEALAQGKRMAELQRLSPPLWGLAEAARCQGDHDTALMLCERGFQASADAADAAYLFPYLLTGVRAHLAHNEAWGFPFSRSRLAR